MIYFVDIDDTICREYHIPLLPRIQKINELYNQGNRIVYYTSRGVAKRIDLKEQTTRQLQEWGCLYHELRLDKPVFDLLIDDKAINCENFFQGV